MVCGMDTALDAAPATDPFAAPLAHSQIGLAMIDEDLTVRRRCGALSAWLPEEGAPACASPLLLHMEESFAAARRDGGEIVLPSMRGSAEGASRVTISIVWDADARAFIVVTTPDHGGDQIDRLLASERREKQLLQQQADAAASRLRVADALYRDIVESSDDLVLRFHADFTVVFANRAAARFLGRAQDALIGAALDELFPASESAPWRFERAAERPASFETAARAADGRVVWLAFEVRFLGAEAGGEFQAVARDVTTARRLRVERERAQEEGRAAAVANERLRIAHDLHDTLVRSIVTLIAESRLIAKKTRDENVKAQLAELELLARDGLIEAREAITMMRAARAEDADLRRIVDDFAGRAADAKVVAEFSADPAAMPRETQQLFGAVLREALRNVELHADARTVRIALRSGNAMARLDIVDDGAGFDPSAPAPGHFGVAGMRERARLAGATLGLESAHGKGTRVTLIAPLAEG